jgi:hypothetical protein
MFGEVRFIGAHYLCEAGKMKRKSLQSLLTLVR